MEKNMYKKYCNSYYQYGLRYFFEGNHTSAP